MARPGGWFAVLVAATFLWGESSWAQSRPKTYFVGQDGVPVLTNRPYVYRARSGYVEKTIVFDPVVVTGRYRFSPGQFSAKDFRAMVTHWAKRYRLDPNLVLGLIRAESGFDPNAVSKSGARGLMQLMPGTAADMNVNNAFDPEQNIAGGTQYLAKLLEVFSNRMDLALAAYNAGPSTVQDHKGVPPYKETRDYVKKVQQYARDFARGDESIVLASNPQHSPDFLPAEGGKFVIHYKGGTTQPADSVREEALFYAIEYSGRKYLVRKTHVERIAKAD
jgi:soluble lytic murein transglycosylase